MNSIATSYSALRVSIMSALLRRSNSRPEVSFLVVWFISLLALTIPTRAFADMPPTLAYPSDKRALKIFTSNDGLAQNMVLDIAEDTHGFLWFGTKDGLSRYDGYVFRNFHHNPSDSLSLESGIITTLHVCPSGEIWIGFDNGALDVFNPTTEVFHHVHHQQGYTTPFLPQVNGIFEDSLRRHFVAYGDDEVMRIDGGQMNREDKLACTFITILPSSRPKQPIPLLRPFLKALSGEIYCLGANTISCLTTPALSTHVIPIQPEFNRQAGVDLVYGSRNMVEDENGTIWSVRNHELCGWTPGQDAIIRSKLPAQYVGLRSFVRHRDDGTRCWIDIESGDAGPLENFLHFDRISGQFSNTEKVPALFQQMVARQDRTGIIWYGSSGHGVAKYDPLLERIRAFWPEGDLPLHPVATAHPISREEFGTGTIANDLYAMYYFRDHEGNEWFQNPDATGPWLTTYFFRDATGAGQQTIGYASASMRFQFNEDMGGNVWARGKGYLTRWDRKSRTMEVWMVEGDHLRPAGTAAVPDDPYRMFDADFMDTEKALWLGTISNGLVRFDPVGNSTLFFRHDRNDPSSISNDHIISIADDPANPGKFLWVGTDGGGLNRFEKSTGKCRRFTEDDGLPNNVIYAIVPDAKGMLWMTTNRGMFRFDPKTFAVRTFDIGDGLPGMEFNRDEWFKGASGMIYFGGTDGWITFNPDEMTENSHVPQMAFTGLKLNNNPVSVRDGNPYLKTAITETKELVIPSSENVITLEFAALDFRNPAKNKYSYTLEGFQSEWSKPSVSRSATYTNLDPGTYALRVRGSNNDGVWNMEGASLRIIVLPPWYRTWWAYTLYFGFIVAGLAIFRRYDLQRIRLNDRYELANARAEQLKEVDQLKMRFFQNISHEFRTPLTLILGPAEKLLETDGVQEVHKRDLRMMRRNAQRLLGLINQLLDMAKVESGNMKLNLTSGNIVPFVRGIAMSFRSMADRKNIAFDVHAQHETIEAWVDDEKLEKVIINLVGNAFKFTPDGGEISVHIDLENANTGPNPEQVIIRVQDTGIGIPHEKLPHIFDRFYQVESATTRAHEGTGIGLSLTKDLVELHHGSISAESEPGRGSTFIVRIPRRYAGGQPGPHVARELVVHGEATTIINGIAGGESSTTVEAAATVDASKALVLVVEDNADVRAYVKSYLVDNYLVIEACDGADGVAVAMETIPDLVISDVMMPKKDGYELCAALKQDPKTSHIPVILLTAKATDEDRIGGLELGADDYLVKPFSSAELLVRVRNLIELRKLMREKFGKQIATVISSPGAQEAKPPVIKVDDAFVLRLKEIVDKYIGDERFKNEDLADHAGMTVRQLQRKLKGLADTTPTDFVRKYRLHKAKELLLADSRTIAEISYSVGFASPAYFTKCFTEEFGMTPTAMRSRS